jgi:cytosine/adenosine deaminase-related metal-dependent hydrolase
MLTMYRARHVFPVSVAPIRDGALVVEGGRILDVGEAAVLGERHPNARRVDLGDSALLPGAVNAHTHLELSGLAGAIPEGLEFGPWVLELVRARRPLTFADYTQAATEGVALMRDAGTAAVGEISTFGASPHPLAESGMRALVYYELFGANPADAPALLRRGQEQIERWREEYAGTRLRFGLAPHTPYTTSAELLRLATEWCRAEGVPLSIHAAESPAESQFLRDGTGPIADDLYTAAGFMVDQSGVPGKSPIAYLDGLGVLRARPLLAHGVQVDRDDLARLAATETPVAHCPRSNARLHCGRLPWSAYREAGVQMALGTDSLASAPSLSTWDEASYAYTVHSAAGEPPDPHELLRLATLGGAEALGWGDEIGSLAPGKSAELACAALPNLDERERADGEAVLRALVGGRLSVRQVDVTG